MTHVLVLNQDYQAISLCAPERAMVLIFLDKAELVADRTERKMRSVRASFRTPRSSGCGAIRGCHTAGCP